MGSSPEREELRSLSVNEAAWQLEQLKAYRDLAAAAHTSAVHAVLDP